MFRPLLPTVTSRTAKPLSNWLGLLVRVAHLNSGVPQKLVSTPACLLVSAGACLPLWVMSVTVSARAACALLSMSGSDR